MSVLAIRCPTCGSAAASTMTPNEYECSHCRSKFQIVRPADATVVSDLKIHHCPICGRAVQLQQSFKCTECGRVDFCDNCVVSIPVFGTERYACRACVSQKGWACRECGGYADTVCVRCAKRSCEEHLEKMFGLQVVGASGETFRIDFFTCPSCQGDVCWDCIEEKGFLIKTYSCKKCGSRLDRIQTDPRA
jgi:hypothetical protein